MNLSTGRIVRAVSLPGGAMDARQVSDASGVGAYLLELWHQRYGFPVPGGGPAAYGEEDVALVMRIARLAQRRYGGDALAAGSAILSRRTVQRTRRLPRQPLSALRARFVRAVTVLDEARAVQTLTLAFAQHPEAAVISRLIEPAGLLMASQRLQRQPERINAYLYAGVCRQVLNAQAERYRGPAGPVVWLACPRGEIHDVGLHAVRLMLAKDGWSTRLLGQNSDLLTVAEAGVRYAPAAVLLTVSRSAVLHRQIAPLRALAGKVPTFLGGPVVTRADAEATGARVLMAPPEHVGALLRMRLAGADGRPPTESRPS